MMRANIGSLRYGASACHHRPKVWMVSYKNETGEPESGLWSLLRVLSGDNETETKDTRLAQYIFPIAKCLCHPAICVGNQWRDGTKAGNVRGPDNATPKPHFDSRDAA